MLFKVNKLNNIVNSLGMTGTNFRGVYRILERGCLESLKTAKNQPKIP